MSSEQTNGSKSPPHPRRAARISVALVLVAVGAAVLARPLIPSGVAWEWRIASQADLVGAVVNARLVSVGPDGVRLGRQGRRPISLISPPLALGKESACTLVIHAWRIGKQPDDPTESLVRLLWQDFPAAAFHFVEVRANLSRRSSPIVFSLPVKPDRVHRLGLQFPDERGEVEIASISLPALGCSQRLATLPLQLTTPEPLANHSLNFLRGPSALGHSLNYYLVGGSCVLAGLFLLARRKHRESSPTYLLLAVLSIVWIGSDVSLTTGLLKEASREVNRFRGHPWPEQVAAMDGAEIAWAYQSLEEKTPPGATFAVLSDDLFTPAHRLGYLLAPARTRVEDPRRAEFILLVLDSRSAFDAASGTLRIADGSPLRCDLIARYSEDVYLLRRAGG